MKALKSLERIFSAILSAIFLLAGLSLLVSPTGSILAAGTAFALSFASFSRYRNTSTRAK